jgi:N-carbamoylputrescine amidase
MESIRIAAAVVRCPCNRVAENLDRMERWVAAAAAAGARIVCFPELNIPGYRPGPEAIAAAEPVPGPSSEQVQSMAARHGVVVLAGLVERATGGDCFATHLVAAPDGRIGLTRKLYIAPPERGGFAAGDAVPLFEAAGVRFGIQLCYDAHFPELATRMAIDGADVIFMPHASPRGTPDEKRRSWMRHLPARAFDNGLFVVACNALGDNGAGLEFPGVALVIGPDGRVLAERCADDEGLLVVDLDAAALEAVRRHPMRYFLPHRRDDLCGLPV